jgi:uncharacterized protein GlcG (DUF336 family)
VKCRCLVRVFAILPGRLDGPASFRGQLRRTRPSVCEDDTLVCVPCHLDPLAGLGDRRPLGHPTSASLSFWMICSGVCRSDPPDLPLSASPDRPYSELSLDSFGEGKATAEPESFAREHAWKVVIRKAEAAATLKRPTKAWEQRVADGRTVIVSFRGGMPFEGGVPITVEGEIIGAIGRSGAMVQEDGMIARTGVDALPKILAE